MTTPELLARLQARAIENPMEEPAFFQALLGAVLYVHLPLSDDSGRVRLISFTRPDGLTVIPVFSDEVKAHAASQGAAKVAAALGRELFLSAPGATWMLDPNDVGCTLYPEEVATLLRDGCMPIVQKHSVGDPTAVKPPRHEDTWIAEAVVRAAKSLESIKEVYLVEAAREEPQCASGLLVVLAVSQPHTEQAVRAVGIALVACPQVPRLPVDVTVYDSGDPPEWLVASKIVALWCRRCDQAQRKASDL